jgi:hypothetical protein
MASGLQTKVMQISRVAIETLTGWWQARSGRSVCQYWSISMSILIGRKPNTQLNLPQPSAQVRSQCADVTTTSWGLVVISCDWCRCAGIQISRPGSTYDPCRCLLTPNLARSQRTPLFVCALNRNTTDGEQRCLWVQVGLAVSQTHFGTAIVPGGRQSRP